MTKNELSEKTFDLLERTGLNWTVNKLPLYSGTGLTTESFGIFRNDTEDWLGTVGNRYVEMQNHTLAETLIKASEGVNLNCDRGGLLDNGKKVYLQAELADEYIGKSPVKRMITAINSHDGTSSIGFGSTNIVIVCKNTFHRAFGELLKFRHTSSAEHRIDIAMKDLRISMEKENLLMTNFKKMADLELQDEIIERVINKIFNVKADADNSKISSRKANQVRDFGIATRQSINEQGNTVWALFNGVTRYTNFYSAPSKPEDKQKYIMTGLGYDIANDSFNTIMKWIEERTEKKSVVIL